MATQMINLPLIENYGRELRELWFYDWQRPRISLYGSRCQAAARVLTDGRQIISILKSTGQPMLMIQMINNSPPSMGIRSSEVEGRWRKAWVGRTHRHDLSNDECSKFICRKLYRFLCITKYRNLLKRISSFHCQSNLKTGVRNQTDCKRIYYPALIFSILNFVTLSSNLR